MKRFLCTMLTAALTFGGVTVSLTPLPQVSAAAVPTTMPDDVKEQVKALSDEELITLLEMARDIAPDYIPEDTYQNVAMLRNDCTFETNGETIIHATMEGDEIFWLNPAEIEILQTRFPEIFEDLAPNICLYAGYYMNDGLEINSTLIKEIQGENGVKTYMPNYAGILSVLSRGPYTVEVNGTAKTNCTASVKLNKQYTVTATYEAKASDGGEFELSYMGVEAKYNRKKPTLLTIELYSSAGETKIIQTFKLKMSKSLQKKIKTGKVVLTGTNISSYKNEFSISKDIDTAGGKTSGTVKLNFKFVNAKK